MNDKEEARKQRIAALEAEMAHPDFWQNKDGAQKKIREYNDLKTVAEGGGRYDAGDCIITLFSGAGGDDSEDFAAMLFKM